MRTLALAALLLASPASAAGIPTAATWTLDVHDVGPARSVDAVLTARRLGTGWRFTLTCEVTDRRARRVVARERHAGVGVRRADAPGVITGMMDGGTQRITIAFGSGEPMLLTSYQGCPTGRGNLGTGD